MDESGRTTDTLDVLSHIRSAREHATKAVVSWVVATGAVIVVALQFPQLLGWPEIDYRVEARVVQIHETAEGTAVFFEGSGGGNRIRWARLLDDSSWDTGERIEGSVAEDGRFYPDDGLGWIGPPDLVFFLLVGLFVVFAARRWVGVVIAQWDVRDGRDSPRLGYVALIDNPVPKTWRSVLLVWNDPDSSPVGTTPDHVYLADEETGQELMSSGSIQPWQAWIDTGRFPWSKPRWVGVRDGVFIPHRRALLSGMVARAQVRRGMDAPIAMDRAAPDPSAPTFPSPPVPSHDLRKMLLGRVGVAVATAVLAGFIVDGETVRIIG